MLRTVLRLAMLAAIASAVASVVTALREGPSPRPANGSGTPDTWPEVPGNPEA